MADADSGQRDPSLREYVEALFERDRRAREAADAERARAAEVLAVTLTRRFEQVDRALRDRVDDQVMQLRAEAAAQDRLEVARVAGNAERIEAVRRELVLIQDAGASAIAKAEAATERRFESVNEFRAQLTDTISRFQPREVADAQLAEMRKALGALTDRLNTMTGSAVGQAEQRQGLHTNVQLAIATIAVVVTILIAGGVIK